MEILFRSSLKYKDGSGSYILNDELNHWVFVYRTNITRNELKYIYSKDLYIYTFIHLYKYVIHAINNNIQTDAS